MAEGKLFVITGFGGGVSKGMQADSFDEFLNLAQQVYGQEAGRAFAENVFAELRSYAPAPTDAQAVANVQQAFPGAQVTTVGQPLPQPTYVQQPQQQPAQQQRQQNKGSNPNRILGPAGAPPNVAYPGPCAHGDRVYSDAPARGNAWVRWECNIPWSRGAQGRCDAVNVTA